MQLKSLRHWFNAPSFSSTRTPYQGPKEGAALLAGDKIVKLSFVGPDQRKDLSLLNTLDPQQVRSVFLRGSSGWWGEAEVVGAEGEIHTLRTESCTYLSDAISRIGKLVSEQELYYENLRTSPEKHLEVRLQGHDWYSVMSDSYRVTRRGEADMEGILKLMKQVPAESARLLWTKYAPAGCSCPV